jgi:type IV fimbrial biogenesis protein FimT
VDNPNPAVTQACARSTQQNWQSGWLVFVNPRCDASVTVPAVGDLIGIVNAANPKLMLKSEAPKPDYLMFSPTGYPRASDAGSFALNYVTTGSMSSDRKICLNAVGNVATVDLAGVCP